ncbi:CRISPR-associated protein Cas2 [Psychrobacillus insolitus]|uniref:CRISPR-associated endoribonuclease Cas2 n=1 Tax=Psychrobacillus insolitus TaxID=1461 RepID=A0A2W7MI35_9BACI|nr:CRISPR-associated endonuclease Cas2 [Psychrobacillus insolitus]PZX05811.1 CRISPR-associated protein Cas2 [Psychrobacillus insolitus]
MFVIISYDVDVKRVAKVHKVLKKYLTWTQNSVFEGEITEGKLKQCLAEISRKTGEHYDSIYIYRVENPKHIKKVVFGVEKDFESMFL